MRLYRFNCVHHKPIAIIICDTAQKQIFLNEMLCTELFGFPCLDLICAALFRVCLLSEHLLVGVSRGCCSTSTTVWWCTSNGVGWSPHICEASEIFHLCYAKFAYCSSLVKLHSTIFLNSSLLTVEAASVSLWSTPLLTVSHTSRPSCSCVAASQSWKT